MVEIIGCPSNIDLCRVSLYSIFIPLEIFSIKSSGDTYRSESFKFQQERDCTFPVTLIEYKLATFGFERLNQSP